jgi:hypothetical protein
MAKIGIKFAKQPTKGAPKDGCFRDITPAKENPQNPYTNPSKVSKTLRGVEPIKGKLGS